MHTEQTVMLIPGRSLGNSAADEARRVAVYPVQLLVSNQFQMSTPDRPKTFLTNSQIFADRIASAYEEFGVMMPIRAVAEDDRENYQLSLGICSSRMVRTIKGVDRTRLRCQGLWIHSQYSKSIEGAEGWGEDGRGF